MPFQGKQGVGAATTITTRQTRGAEVTEPHTRLLRVPLVVEDSRAYWRSCRPDIPHAQRHTVAFEERWFGSKSMARVRGLLANFHHRFDAFPAALDVLRRWRPRDPAISSLICHWHTQLTDRTYRDLTGGFFEQRRIRPEATVDRDLLARWVKRTNDDKWASATTIRMANSLLTTASEASLCTRGPGERRLKYPTVPDDALAYLLYLLRDTELIGSLIDNPYLASVGLTGGFLEQRLTKLDAISFSRMGDLTDVNWRYADLTEWAATMGGRP